MEKIQINIYKANELSKSSVEKAHMDWKSNLWYYSEDNDRTIDAFYDIFNSQECGSVELTGHRLAKYIINNYWDRIHVRKVYFISSTHKKHNRSRKSNIQITRDCPLTGYYLDNVILGPIYDFIDHPVDGPTLSDLVREGISKFNEEVDKDYEYYYSMDGFLEECDGNEYRFLKDGTRIDNLLYK